MRVLIVTQHFWPENFRVNDLAAGLVSRGHEVTVLTGLPNYPSGRFFPGYNLRGPWSEQYAGMEIVRVPLLSRGHGRGIRLILNYLSFVVFGIWGALFRLRGPFDAIFVSESSPVTVGIPAAFARWRFKAPILFWVLDLWPDTLAATGVVRSPAVLRAVSALGRWVYAQCARVLVQSKAFIPGVENHGVNSRHILYFPNWVESAYSAADQSKETPLPELPKGFKVMFAGNIGMAQDFPSILAAAELLKARTDVHWVIIGDGRMAGWVKDEVFKRGLTEQVHFLGQHPTEMMPRFFAQADALLVSLKQEPLFAMTIPGKVQSYLACGRPTLAMLDGEGAKVVEEASAGLVCGAGDYRGLAANIERLALLSPMKRKEMGDNGRRYAADHFHRERLFDNFEQWMREVVEEQAAPQG